MLNPSKSDRELINVVLTLNYDSTEYQLEVAAREEEPRELIEART